jgi:hypothetical protein
VVDSRFFWEIYTTFCVFIAPVIFILCLTGPAVIARRALLRMYVLRIMLGTCVRRPFAVLAVVTSASLCWGWRLFDMLSSSKLVSEFVCLILFVCCHTYFTQRLVT